MALKFFEELVLDVGHSLKGPMEKLPTEVRSVFGWTDVEGAQDPASPSQRKTLLEHQQALPRLPVPDLEQTAALYLESVKPLVSENRYKHTEAVVREFIAEGGHGRRLQKRLQDFAASQGQSAVPSWLEPFWDDSYLKSRDSIAINVNYCFGFEDHPLFYNDQICRAASLLHGAVTFFHSMYHANLPLDHERGQPLCMSQYLRVFGSTRIPVKKRDILVTYTTHKPVDPSPSTCSQTTTYSSIDPSHVVVIKDNRFFWFDVLTPDLKYVRPLEEIEAALGYIKAQEIDFKPLPIGVFTAINRDNWATAREKLLKCGNKEILDRIQSALMIVCLDSIKPEEGDEFARLLLHGPGTNRWFDKHNLIVCANGKAGINFEHAVGDGATTLRVADEMYQWSARYGNCVPAKPQGAGVHILEWSTNEDILTALRSAYSTFKEAILANETSSLDFTRFGGGFIKSCGMSPDAFVQVAIQLAYYKMYGESVATYEAASTRAFLHGRTETVRSCTSAAAEFVRAATVGHLTADSVTKYQLLKKAVLAHVAYMKKAKSAHGVDRHLFGLQVMAAWENKKEDEFLVSRSFTLSMAKDGLFDDPSYAESSTWKISTSHCGSPSLACFGFGPVVSDGVGIGYMIKNNNINFTITTKYGQRSATVFTTVLEESLLALKAIALCNPDLKPPTGASLHFKHPTITNPILDMDYFDAPEDPESEGGPQHWSDALDI